MSSGSARAAPGHRAGRGSQHHRRNHDRVQDRELRSAIAPGEDRNHWVSAEPLIGAVLRPAIAPGEDRNTVIGATFAGHPVLRPAIAPGEDRNRRPPVARTAQVKGCARPSRRARIATVAHRWHEPHR